MWCEIERKLSVDVSRDSYTTLRNVSRKHTISLKIPSDCHVYIVLTVHAFKQFTFLWIELVGDYYFPQRFFG